MLKFKKISMMLTALAVVACTASTVSASAATKLNCMEGSFNNAVAYDNGKVTFYGYISDDDDMSCYQSDGKYYKNLNVDDYDYEDMEKFGKKFTKVVLRDEESDWNDHSKDKTYLVDLSNGKLENGKSLEEKKDELATKLQKKLSQTDRYGKVEKPQLVETVKDAFGEVWYQYIVKPASGDETVAKVNVNFSNEVKEDCLYGFVNEKGYYIDACSLKESEDDLVDKKITEYVGTIAQDANYIYTLIKVDDGNWYIQQLAKKDGCKIDGAYEIETENTYRLDDSVVKFLTEENSEEGLAAGMYGKVIPQNGYLSLVQVDEKIEKIKVTNLNFIPSNSFDDDYKYTGLVRLGSSCDEDLPSVQQNNYGNKEKVKFAPIEKSSVSVDVNNNLWIICKGKISKFNGSDFTQVFQCDRSLNRLDVYDDKNLVAYDADDEVYSAYQNGKSYGKPLIAK